MVWDGMMPEDVAEDRTHQAASVFLEEFGTRLEFSEF
jgi:hypothetical protein